MNSFDLGMKMTIFMVISLFLLSVLMTSSSYDSMAMSEALSSPNSSIQIQNATVHTFQTSIQLPSGSQLYLYGFATGGGYPSTGFANGESASSTTASGNLVAAIAVTIQDNNGFSTSTSYQAIGGVGVSGFSSYSPSYGVNNDTGAGSVSTSVKVNAAGSLVVIIAIPGGETYLNLTGLPSLQVDASSANTPGQTAVVIAHSYPNTGRYTVTMSTQGDPGQTPSNMGDLLGVFVFSPSSGQGGSPNTSSSHLYYELLGAVGVVVVLAIGIIIVQRRTVSSKTDRSGTEKEEESANREMLERLETLRDSGLITQADFEKQAKALSERGGK